MIDQLRIIHLEAAVLELLDRIDRMDLVLTFVTNALDRETMEREDRKLLDPRRSAGR